MVKYLFFRIWILCRKSEAGACACCVWPIQCPNCGQTRHYGALTQLSGAASPTKSRGDNFQSERETWLIRMLRREGIGPLDC